MIQQKNLSKNFTKNVAWKLVPVPFLFLKNRLYRGIFGRPRADFDIF